MFKSFLYSIITLLICCYPASAETFDAKACNHDTGDCYSAEVSTDDGLVIIYLSDTDLIKLELDDDYPDDLTAYDEDKNIYYDLELLK